MLNLKCKNYYKFNQVSKKLEETNDESLYMLIDFYKTTNNLMAIVINEDGFLLALPYEAIKIIDEKILGNNNNNNKILNG